MEGRRRVQKSTEEQRNSTPVLAYLIILRVHAEASARRDRAAGPVSEKGNGHATVTHITDMEWNETVVSACVWQQGQ